MTASNFAPSLAAVLKSEGGNDDDPADHGGRTSRGITQREYDAWRRERNDPVRDVLLADSGEIETIYHDEYWLPDCDRIPTPLDYMVFDMKVNAGPHPAIVLLQRALGVTADGRLGPITRERLATVQPRIILFNYTDAKRTFYHELHQPRFLRGWLNRCNDVQAVALEMLKGTK